MENIKVSVIIPVYNPGKLLVNCLNSIVNQSLKDIEIICVDDGSTDHSLDILKDYAKNDFRFKIYSQDNLGAGCARNKGIENSNGEYIIFVDSDDWIEPDMCEKLYYHAENLNADLVLFDTIWHLENNKIKKVIHFDDDFFKSNYDSNIFDYNSIKDLIMNGYYGVIWCKFYKASFIKNNNILFPNHKIYNDVEFHIKTTTLAKRIAYLPEFFYHYIKLGQSSLQTSFVGGRHMFVFLDVVNGMKNFLSDYNLFTEFKDEFLVFLFVEFNTKLNQIDLKYKEEYFLRVKEFLESLYLLPDDFNNIELSYFAFYIHLINTNNYYEFLLLQDNFDIKCITDNF